MLDAEIFIETVYVFGGEGGERVKFSLIIVFI
jgi:hypothetical protein